MKPLMPLLVAACLCGCNASLGVQLGASGRSATAPSVGPGGSFSSSGVGVRFGDMPGVGSLLGAVGLGWLMGGGRVEDSRHVPPMDSARQVNDQDCGQPVRDPSANLRCR